MGALFLTLCIGAAVFAVTNVDQLLVLVGFFADPDITARQVATGQIIGIAVLYGVSVAASLLALVLPPAATGMLGLAPIMIGVAKFLGTGRATGARRKGRRPGGSPPAGLFSS